MFGCLIVGIVNNGLNLLSIDPNWQVIAQGVLILIAVIIDVLSSRSYAKRLSKQASLALKAEMDELRARHEAGEIDEPKFMG
jgi:membrane protein implicated in regulation of membrane protease activity